MNNYANLPDGILNQRVGESTTVLIEQYLEYGLTETEVEILDAANAQFASAISLAGVLENDRKSAVAQKNEDRATVLFGINTIAKKLYANPALDDSQLTKAGLAPRAAYGGRTSPKIPTNLVANAFSDGRVSMQWNRNGASRSSVFTVWAKGSTGDWTAVASGTKTRMTLEGFTPGQFKSFKVTSTVNNLTSAASNIASIYESSSAETFTIAA